MIAPSRLPEKADQVVGTVPGSFARGHTKWVFLRSVSILSGGSTVAQLLNLLVAPVLTRLYSPSNLGEYALFMAFLNIAVVAASLRYEFAIISARDDSEAAQLTLGALLLALPMSVVASFAFYGLVRNALLGYEHLPVYAALLVVPAVLFIAGFTGLRFWSLRSARFGLISRGTIIQNAGRALSQLGLGWSGLHTSGLIAGEVIGRCAGISRMLLAAWPFLKREFANSSLRQLAQTLTKNRQFAIYSLPSSLLDVTASSISLPIIVHLYGLDAGGNYALVWRILALPAVLVTDSVADVFHTRASLAYREDPLALSTLMKKTAGTLLFLGVLPASILVAFGPKLFDVVFGNRWLLAGTIAAWVSPWFLGQFIVSPLSRIVLIVGRQKIKFVYDMFTFVGTIAIFTIAYYRAWPFMTTIATLAAVKTTAYAMFFLILLNIASRANKKPTLSRNP